MKLSICIPTYNKPAELRRLLKSIECQTYRDFEIIISDDSDSSEPAQKIIADFGTLPIKYFFHNPAFEPAQNWNFLLDQAKGEYIKIMHDDDWFASDEALERMVDGLRNEKMVFCQSKDINANGSAVNYNAPAMAYIEKELEHPTHLLLGNWIGAPSCVLHQKSDLRYDENLKWFVDIDLYIMLIRQLKNHISYVPMSLVNIGVDGNRMTNECNTNMQVIGEEYFYCLRKYRRLHIISVKEYGYMIYCFIRNYKLKSYKELEPYYDSILGKMIFWVYKIRKL